MFERNGHQEGIVEVLHLGLRDLCSIFTSDKISWLSVRNCLFLGLHL